ncbi:aminopeptidase [Longibacter salinarum]|uniref:Aminopeptidase N n=1 Tax=Longibacter salinarum TaxID=1850348 RepID=A0A2A8D1D9_9BACT|nr:M1 family metallopeptidase [Longibacter salinarum]PEN14779.1 aminopeptidase [Longibacter salinarum]
MLRSLRLLLLVGFAFLSAGCSTNASGQDSGGPILPQQAAYDVTYYDLNVDVDTASQSITGELTAVAAVKKPLEHFVLNLDTRLDVREVNMASEGGTVKLPVERKADRNQLWMKLPDVARPGDTLRVTVEYGGAPRVAPRPPWDGGFTWSRTPEGAPWIATSCQTIGADMWWPVKDHPSDEPDSMAVNITLPRPLVAASNGRLRSVEENDSTRTYRWFVSTPINPYAVALHAAPYSEVDTTYESTTGEEIPVTFYAVPTDAEKARSALPHFLDHVRFLEETLGPYPFRADKYGIAQTPFKGMEHQTIIAYGNGFNLEGGLYYNAGFDALHFHELAHEWYGNLVTAGDWKDFWIHEGFATYLEALYREELQGEEGYLSTVRFWEGQITNSAPVARGSATSAQDMYGSDVYYKGALILHTLRYVLGDEDFAQLLRQFTYPSDEMRRATDGSQARTVTTADFVQAAEQVSGQQLDAFFRVYLYQAELPLLEVEKKDAELKLTWTRTGGIPLDVPVPVSIDGETRRVEFQDGAATLSIPSGASVQVDERGRVLKDLTVLSE